MRWPVRIILLLASVLAANQLEAQSGAMPGRAIVDVIDALRAEGNRIVYSEDLVPARLRVTVEPTADTALERLRQILAPHALAVEIGPGDTWLVVRGKPPAPAASADGAGSSLVIVPPTLDRVVVTASRYAIERADQVSSSRIGRRVLDNTPALGQDPLRVTQNLPGVSSNELSARSHIRGGNLDETLIELDGVRLYNPYHLKDFQNVFSSINPRVIDSMDVRTGGFEARYGDRLAGVVAMESITPVVPRHYELATSLLDASVLSSGVFSNGRSSWVTSLRRGNLDTLADLANADIGELQYRDFFNTLRLAPTARLIVTTGIMSLHDELASSPHYDETAAATYDDRYLWLTLDHSADSGLESRIQLVRTDLDRARSGRIDEPEQVIGSLSERASFDVMSLGADWSFGISDKLRAEWGIEYADTANEHELDFARQPALTIELGAIARPSAPPPSARVGLSQSKRALYASFRVQFTPNIVADFGARWDAQSLTGQEQLSPRLNLLFDVSDRTSFRAAWGRFAQSQSPEELAVADGAMRLYPAQIAEHRIVGIDHSLGASVSLRAEIYSKDIAHPSPRFENVYERVTLVPELLPDRYEFRPAEARIRGIELGFEGETGPFSWWANLSRARSEDRFGARWVKRSWDQAWSVKGGGEWSSADWTVTASAELRSGWPITALALDNAALTAGEFNAERLPGYMSVNLRVNRHLQTRRAALDWYLELSNLFNRNNYCCLGYEYRPPQGAIPASLNTDFEDLLGLVPNIGVRWQL